MKYMNNHFGQSRIFGCARCKIPMNLQLFAEGGEGDGGTGGGDGTGSGSDGGDGGSAPTVEELMAQLAQERAEKEKLRLAKDKANSEAAKYKKSWEAKTSAEEQEAEAKKAADEAKDARIQELESKFRTMDYSKRYMGIGMDEKTAEALSELTGELTDTDKFFSALGKFVQAVKKQSSEDAVQAYLKDNPDIKAGSGDGTKNSLAEERAMSIGKRTAGANEDILKHYRR